MAGGKEVPINDPDFLDRFWDKVNKKGKCWIWTAALSDRGYGSMEVRGNGLRAHVISWCIAHHRNTTPNLLVLHKCDNPSCVNPKHLFLGTPQDNTDDMRNKGRDKWVGRPLQDACNNGHIRTEENTYLWFNAKAGRMTMQCKICKKEYSLAMKRRKK